jgi:UDP-N-acetylglucosamine/UDP-N-acetylgalactosamine diphosphorylase
VLAEPVSDRLVEVELVQQRLEAHGQDALLAEIAQWAPDARARVLGELAAVDLDELFGALRSDGARTQPRPVRRVVEPAPIRRIQPGERDRLAELGAQLLRDGAAAALVVAGGMGTRLGSAGPKGALAIGPVSEQSLFAHHAAQIRGFAGRAGAPIPWVVMTSSVTHPATEALFEACDYFGLPREDVFFVQQQDLPCLDLEGNLMVAAPGRLAWSPDGHGGVFEALRRSAVLEQLAARGVQVLAYFQVDNPLLPVVDPTAIGAHFDAGSDWTVKVITKQRPDEKLGNCVLGDGPGPLRIIEYTELAEPERSQRRSDGELRISSGAIGAHLLDLEFVHGVARGPRLPLHRSPKRIPVAQDLEPREANGYKLERFVFDALPRAERAQALHVERADEYAPVKNASGEHSPATARAALSARNRRWLASANRAVGPGPVEIDLATWPDAGALLSAPASDSPATGADGVTPGILVGEGVEL